MIKLFLQFFNFGKLKIILFMSLMNASIKKFYDDKSSYEILKTEIDKILLLRILQAEIPKYFEDGDRFEKIKFSILNRKLY